MNSRKEHSPYYRILPDGRDVPYVKGVSRTEEHRQNQSKALRGRKMPVDAVISRMTVWSVARPFVLRGAIPTEIVSFTDLSLKQAQNAINRRRLLFADEDYEANRTERKKRADQIRKPWMKAKYIRSEDEERSAALARLLIRDGFIKDDLTNWFGLVELYKKDRRQLPYRFSDRLRLEVFLTARIALERDRNDEPLRRYLSVGSEIGSKWFGEFLRREEDFIARTLSARMHLYDGEDNKGFYRVFEEEKWCQYVETDDVGQSLFDNSELASKRREARKKQVLSSK